jgi:hypothetical protein
VYGAFRLLRGSNNDCVLLLDLFDLDLRRLV